MSKYTSPHDLPWWSDPDYDESGNLLTPARDYGAEMDDAYEQWRYAPKEASQ